MVTIEVIKEYQERMEEVKENGFKAIDFKTLGKELQDRFNLSVREVTAILNNRTDEILELLKKQ